MLLSRWALAALLALLVAAGSPVLAQQANVNYVYDEGRLIAVIDQHGDVARYNYDAVGNLLSIERINATGESGAVAITLVTPNHGKVGATVTLFGKGFSATPSQNAVSFNGTAASVTEAAPNRLVTTVPVGATTGSIALTAPLGNATSPSAFTVIAVTGALAVTPVSALILPTHTQQFDATLNGLPTTAVNWSVNGIPGGDPAVGTITTNGVYTAPSTQALGTTVTVSATHIDDPALIAIATAIIVVPRPITTAASVAVLPAAATVSDNLIVAGSVQHAPLVTGVSPSGAARGTSGLTVTLAGVGFTDATAVAFRLANATDGNITVSNLSVTSDTELTVTITIASGAATGARVLHITTPSGSSTVTGTGSNLFTVQ